MKIIKWYVVGEILKIFLVTIGITMLLLTLGGGAKEGIRRGLPPHIVVQTMPYLVPEMLRFTVPGCLLFAVCSVFGRMTASNEIVAMKSLGINPLSVILPVLVVAYVLSIATIGTYDACAVWARPNLRHLFASSIDQIAYGFLRTNGSFSSNGISIVVKGVEGDRLLQPVINIDRRGEKPAITLTAKEAMLRCDRESGTLRIECLDANVKIAGKGSIRRPGRFVYDLVLHEPDPHPENTHSPAALGSLEIPNQICRERGLVDELRAKLSASDASDTDDMPQLRTQLDQHNSWLFRWEAESPRRFSNGLGCLCFAMIGVPVAMWGRSSDTMSVFFLCFMPILLVYYPLLVIGENLARDGVFPQLSVWLANAVLFVIGTVLLLRQMRR